MAIHWKIPFKSLRTGTVYTANVYDDSFSGTAVILKGGAQPFVTEEDSDDDVFTPLRTQSGYLRIVDDGRDASGNVLSAADSVDTMLPQTDTDRFVTLTNAAGIAVWRGFLQAQDFGFTLYGGTQEKNIPLQCPLTALSSKDVGTTLADIRNFAWHILRCLASIGITDWTYHFQGGTYALSWLLKQADPQLFVSETDGELAGLYDYRTVLEDICRFWGWTCRVQGMDIYFLAPDDTTTDILTLTYAEMMALGQDTDGTTEAGTVESVTSVGLAGDIFASFENEDCRVRGYSRATVTSQGGSEDTLMELYPDKVEEWMNDQQKTSEVTGDYSSWFTADLLSFPSSAIASPLLAGTATSGYGSFCIAAIRKTTDAVSDYSVLQPTPALRLKKPVYDGTTCISLQTVMEHDFYIPSQFKRWSGWDIPGYLTIDATAYWKGEKYTDADDDGAGKYTLLMRIGIGKTRGTALWWGGPSTGWTASETECYATIGNEDSTLHWPVWVSGNRTARQTKIPTDTAALRGRLFIDVLGVLSWSGSTSFLLTDFKVSIHRGTDNDLADEREYQAGNGNMVRSEWNSDLIYASDNDLEYGFGVVLDPAGGMMATAAYAGGDEHPEQHMADRVSDYWAASRRKIYAELRADQIPDIHPCDRVSLDGTTCQPVSISRDWRDDKVMLTLFEL